MSPFAPWTQQVRGARYGEPPPTEPPRPPTPPPPPTTGMERFEAAGGWTWPWQEEHWTAPMPEWARTVGKAGLGVGLTAGAMAGGMAAPGLMFGLGSKLPWLAGLAGLGTRLAAPAGSLGLLGKLGAPAGLITSSMMAPGALGKPVPPGAEAVPPTEGIPPTVPPTLPEPGEAGAYAGEPFGEPQIVEVGGQRFWWNPMGQGGIGGWELMPEPRVPGLTPEQETAQWVAREEAQRETQLETLAQQYRWERQLAEQQAGYGMEQQAAGAQQRMAQMYAADPYKYWAQLGTPTPAAVAGLTGGEVAPGEEFPTGVPLSTPSAQWWGGLLPSEQQQIAGGLNWMGVDPQDWYSMYQRMIPGLGQRQAGPVWAR